MDELTVYTAGFFDGEGCVTSGNYNGVSSVRINLAQKHLPVLLDIQKRWGGGISKHSQQDDVWMLWMSKQKETKTFLEAIYPHVRVKKKEVAYAILALRNSGPAKELLIQRMRLAAQERREEKFECPQSTVQ
jgi:hypothetical protein